MSPPDCSLNYPLGKHVIHEASNISFSHLACEDQAAVVVHWSASPLGKVHIPVQLPCLVSDSLQVQIKVWDILAVGPVSVWYISHARPPTNT